MKKILISICLYEKKDPNNLYEKQKPILFKNKDSVNYPILQNNVVPCNIPIQILVEYILKGASFKCAILKGKKDIDFVTQQLFCIDIDNDNTDEPLQTIEDIKNIALKNNLPICFSYYTFSHTENKPKFRVAFLSNIRTDKKEEVELINKYIISLFIQADKVTYNASRLYLGTNKKDLAININYDMFDYENILEKAIEYNNTLKKDTIQLTNNHSKQNYNYSNSSDYDDLKEKIKENSKSYMLQYKTKVGYYCCKCNSGNGKNKTGIRFIRNTTMLKCFSCEWSGDIIRYHQILNNLEYANSVKELANYFNIDFDFTKRSNDYIDKEEPYINDLKYNYSVENDDTNYFVGDNDTKIKEIEELKNIDKKTKKDKFKELINNITFKPNLTINFEKDKVIQVSTGGGKTYNLIQLCLNKIINKTSKKIIIMTASNDLVSDFIDKLTEAIKELLNTQSNFFNFESIQNLLDYANILKLNIDTPKVEDFNIYDIVITNQAYLYPKGDTTVYSKKFSELIDIVNNNVDLYELYIDEIHILEKYKYSTISLNTIVTPLENITRSNLNKKTNKYYKEILNDYLPNDISTNIALIEKDLNIYKYEYAYDGLIETNIIFDIIDIVDTKILKRTCIKKIKDINKNIDLDFFIIERLVEINLKNFNNDNYNKAQQDFNNFIKKNNDLFIIESLIEVVDNRKKMTIEFNNHLDFFNYVNNEIPIVKNDIIKLINNQSSLNKKLIFTQTLYIEKKIIDVMCSTYYTTATIDIITQKYEKVKHNSTNNRCKIENIEVLFCSLDLLNRLKSKSSLSIINLNTNLKNTANIILSEKYKVIDLENKIKHIQAKNLTRTVIHYEKDTKTLTDDTKVIKTISDIKITYMQENRQTGTDFNDTEMILLDGKRSVNANEKYNRYRNKNNELISVYQDETTIVFNHCKQTIGRILRGDIKNKKIIVCLPDIIENVDNVENFFNTIEYINLFKKYFKEEFSNIHMVYTDYTNITNKTQATKKVAEFIGVYNQEKTGKQIDKNNRDNLIKSKYKELKTIHKDESTIINLIENEFKVKERQIYRILDIKEAKTNKEEEIIKYIKECLLQNMSKASIIKSLIEVHNLSKSKAYRLLDKYY